MASMKRPRLSAVQVLPDKQLILTFIDGQQLPLDMSADVRRFPGLQALQDERVFAGAQLGDDGWTLEWPDPDIQIGADTVYLDALAQNATDENTRIFIGWRVRSGLSLDMAAEALGVSRRSISRYSSGREAVPRSLALACLGWEALQSSATLRVAEAPAHYEVTRTR